MKKKLLLSIFTFMMVAFTSSLNAQTYNSSVGLRLGSPVSVSYKRFINEYNAIELTAGYRNYADANYFNIAGGYLIHEPIDNIADNLSYYYGGGVSMYFWTFDKLLTGMGSGSSYGIQGYLGLDYKVDAYPVNISVDWVPTVLFGSEYRSGFGADYGAISVRYILD